MKAAAVRERGFELHIMAMCRLAGKMTKRVSDIIEMGKGSRVFSEVDLSANDCLHNVDLLVTWQLAITMQKPEVPKR